MNSGYDVPILVIGLDAAVKGMTHGARRLQPALANELQKAVPPSSAGTMMGRASSLGRMEGRAGSTLSVSKLGDGIELKGGGGDKFFMGSEFGSARTRRKSYVTRSRRGTRYVVNRHTTRMFNPSVGTHGYFATPVWKERLQGIRNKLNERIAREVSGGQ